MENTRQWRIASIAIIGVLVAYIAYLQSEISRLESVTARPAERPATPVAAGPRTLTAEQRAAMLERLGGPAQTSPNPVWFATVPNNEEAVAFQRTLQGIFQEAGWSVRGDIPVRFPMKPGVFIFSADEEPPQYVTTAQAALEAGGVSITSSGLGYREFARQKKEENPDWVGIEMGADVSYVIVIGR